MSANDNGGALLDGIGQGVGWLNGQSMMVFNKPLIVAPERFQDLTVGNGRGV